MKIAITGASGHIGNNLCRYLIDKGFEIKALIYRDDKALRDLPMITIVKGNVNSTDALNELIKNTDIVIHTAATISVNDNNDAEVINTNIRGTENIIKVCMNHKVKRLIHFSSIHAFDMLPLSGTLDENRRILTDSPFVYDLSKSKSEEMVLKANSTDLETVVLSPTSVIGPYDFKPSLIGKAMKSICKNRFPALISGGYDFVDVRDIVEATFNSITMAEPGNKYLLSGKWHSIKEFVELISAVSGCKVPAFICPLWLAKFSLPIARPFLNNEIKIMFNKQTIEILGSGHRNISSEKAKKQLQLKYRPLKTSIADSYNWFKENNYL